MADDSINYSQYAGWVAFPRSPQDLLSTSNCPACFTVLSSTVCAACGLDLGHPDAARLYDASVAAAGALDERLAVIGKIRYETARTPAPAATRDPTPAATPAAVPAAAESVAQITVPAVAADAARPVPIPEPAMAGIAPADSRTGAPLPAAPAQAAPRRSSVQVTLLIVGVSLLSVAAIFFLVYAFINFGIIWRSIIIAAITVAAFVGASLLRRRDLTATAEGIAAFAVVLIYLDAYAIRANDFFDSAKANGTVYWGAVTIIAALGFIAWNRLSRLRLPSIVGYATFPIGVGLLVGGITRDTPTGTSVFLSFLAIAVAGLIHLLAARGGTPALVERVIVLVTSLSALLVSLAASLFAYSDVKLAPAYAAIAVAAVAATHVWTLVAGRTASKVDNVFRWLFAAMAGVAASLAVGLTATRIENRSFVLIAPAVAAVVVALAFSAVAGRVTRSTVKTPLVVAGWSAAAVLALTLLAPMLVAAGSAAVAATGMLPWSIEPTGDVLTATPDAIWAVFALAIVTALTAAVWTATGRLRTTAGSTAILWAALATVVAAVPELRTQWMVMAGWFAIAAASLAALVIARRRWTLRRSHRAAIVTTMIVAGILGFLVSLATTTTWWIGALTVIGILISCRALVTRLGAKAALLGSGIGVALLSVGFVADQLTRDAAPGFEVSLANRLVLTSLAAAVVVLGAAIPDRGASALDRRVEFWVAAGTSVLAVPTATALLARMPATDRRTLLLPQDWTSLAIALILLAALTLWVGLRTNKPLRPERAVASIAAAPVLYLAAASFARLLQLPEFVSTVVPVTAALLAAAGSLAVTTLRPGSAPRWTRELGVALVGIPAVFAVVRTDDGLTWLVLLLAAVAALLLAVDRDGLFSSGSARRHIGWIALALATAGLWWRLTGDRVTNLEFYVVPLTLALLVIAALIAITTRREVPPRDSAVAPLLALGAFLVTLLPLGVNAATGSTAYAAWLFAIAAILLVAGSAVTRGVLVQRFSDAGALAGAIGVVVIAYGRPLFLPLSEPQRDIWPAAAFVALAVAAFLQARGHVSRSERFRSIASQALGVVALTVILVIEIPAMTQATTGGVRAFTLVVLFSAIHVIAFLVSRMPLTRLLATVAIVYAAISALASMWADTLHPVELASIPIALALLATGAVQLRTEPSSRSWPWLGPGTAILLVPSLLATMDERPLWRLVGLGIAAVAVIVAAVVLRLQSPFTIGVVVVLIHGIATFLPQLRAAYEFLPWWLWLGAGGVLLIVLAARYEQRIRNLKDVALKFAALR